MTRSAAPRRATVLLTTVAATVALGPFAGLPAARAAIPAAASTHTAVAATTGCPAPVAPPSAAALVANYSGDSVQQVNAQDPNPGDPHTPGSGTLPAALAITPDGSTAWLADRGTHSVDPYSLADGTFGTRISLGATASPLGVAISPDGSTLWTVDSAGNALVPVRLTGSAANSAGAAIDLGPDAHPAGVAVSTDGRQVFVAEFGAGALRSVPAPGSGLPGGTVSLGSGSEPSAVAVSPDGSTAWVTDQAHSTVTPIATNGLAVGTPVALPAGSEPDAIALSPDGSRAYVADALTDAVSVLSLQAGAGTVAGSGTDTGEVQLPTGSRPSALSVSPDGGTVLVADFGTDDVTPIDASSARPVPGNPIPVGDGPDAIAYRPVAAPVAALRVSSATPTAGQPVTLDASASTGTQGLTFRFDFGDGTPVTSPSPCTTATHTYASPGAYTATVTVTDGYGTSTAQVFTGQTVSRQGGSSATASTIVHVVASAASNLPHLVVSAAGDNDLVSHPTAGGTATPVGTESAGTATASSPGATALSADGSTAFVALPGSGQLQAVNLNQGSAAAPVAVCSDPESVAVTPNGALVVVACGTGNDVAIYSVRQGRRLLLPTVGGTPSGVAVTTDGASAWIPQASGDSVTSVALGSGTVGRTITLPTGAAPSAAAVTPDGTRLLVTEQGADALAVVDLASYAVVQVALPAGAAPRAVAVTPDGSTAWVADTGLAQLSAVSLSGQGAPSVIKNASLPSGTSGAAHPVALTVTPDGSTVIAADDRNSALEPVTSASSPAAAAAATAVATGTSPADVVAAPDDAPQASLSASGPSGGPSAVTGQSVTLDASASSAPSSAIVSYRFDFGDGTAPVTQSTPTISHAYPTAGSYTASVTETDADGTSTATVFTGRTLSLAGSSDDAVASASVLVTDPGPTVTGLDPVSGPQGGGTTVTVTGTDLTGATDVAFGATPATDVVVAADGSSLTAVSPPGTGSVDVTVTTPQGTSAVVPAVDGFTYVTGTPPAVTGVSPATGAAGITVTVTGTGFTGTTAVRFGAAAATGVSVATDGSLTAVAPAGTGTVDVRVITADGGESAASTGDQFTYTSTSGSGGSGGSSGSGSGGTTPPPGSGGSGPAAPAEPAPRITSLSPDPAIGPAGSTLVVRGNYLAPATAVLFGTTPGSGVRVVPDGTSLLVTVPPGTGAVDVRVVAPTGTSEATTADVFTYGAPLASVTASSVSTLAALAAALAHPTAASTPGVVVAPDSSVPNDALAGVLGAHKHLLVLFSHRGTLDLASLAELRRVARAKSTALTVGLAGGDLTRLTRQLRSAGHAVQALGGSDPSVSALAVAKALGTPSTGVLVDAGNNAADLVAASAAIRLHASLLFTSHGRASASTAAAVRKLRHLDEIGFGRRAPHLLTGTARPRQLNGSSPAALSVAVAVAFAPHTSAVVLASSSDATGAVAGLAYVAAKNATVLLTPPTRLDPAVLGFLSAHGRPGRTLYTLGRRALAPSTTTSARAAWSR